MTQVISLKKGKTRILAKKAFRNWKSRFKEDFSPETCLTHVSLETLSFLAQGKDKGTFYLYDLIMGLHHLGSGFEFNELSPRNKMRVIDQYLFLLDRIRFEGMRRLGWVTHYPGEEIPMVEMITRFETLAPNLQGQIPMMDRNFAGSKEFFSVTTFEKEGVVRKLIPRLIKELQQFTQPV
ncbi:MAG: hypothetical protein HN366_09295 [Deltaproteobacteria bacterium]|jgi:hypothetical protein|nr:hypothetical protein [Deltaproteobacteria bacterium]